MKYIILFLFSILSLNSFSQTLLSGTAKNRAFAEERISARRFVVAGDTLTDAVNEYIYTFSNNFNSAYFGAVQIISDTVTAAGNFAGNLYIEGSIHETQDEWFPIDTISLEEGNRVSEFLTTYLRLRLRFDITDGSTILEDVVGLVKKLDSVPSIVIDDFEGF